MKNGELFEGDTLNEVWPEQKKLEPLWSGTTTTPPNPAIRSATGKPLNRSFTQRY